MEQFYIQALLSLLIIFDNIISVKANKINVAFIATYCTHQLFIIIPGMSL